MHGLRRRGGNGERRSRAHGVARSHVAYHIKFRGPFSFSRKGHKDRKVARLPAILTCVPKTSLYSRTYTEGSDTFDQRRISSRLQSRLPCRRSRRDRVPQGRFKGVQRSPRHFLLSASLSRPNCQRPSLCQHVDNYQTIISPTFKMRKSTPIQMLDLIAFLQNQEQDQH